MFGEYSDLISTIALVISAVSLTISYRVYKRTIGATIKYELENLPPYRSEEEKTKIAVKNVGNAIAKIKRIYVAFSWDKNLINLYEAKGAQPPLRLRPNDHQNFTIRLPVPSKSGPYTVTIITEYDGEEKKEEFQFEVPYAPIF